MNLHDRVAEILRAIGAETVFYEIHNGKDIPLFTDYFIRRLPREWNSGPPPDLVGGKELTPLFTNADEYSIYCIDRSTGVIYNIDPEQPWPPQSEFETWRQFKLYLFRVVGAVEPEDVQETLRDLLQLR